MAERIEPINAIGYAQFHLRGGGKALLLLMAGVVLLVGVIAVPVAVSANNQLRDAARDSLPGLLAIQWLVLTLFGASRVGAAIRQDLTSGVIESHRLTPTSPLAAVFGYLIGGSIQALAVAATVFCIGVGLTIAADMPLSFWLVGNGMALATCALVWSFVALLSFTVTQAGALPAAGIVLAIGAQGLAAIPGFMVLVTPISGHPLWMPGFTSGAVPPGYGFTVIADLLLAGVFVLASARRYRSAVTDAFSIRLGLLLLLIWAAISSFGLAQPLSLWTRFTYDPFDERVRLIAGICSLLIVALAPVVAAARAAVMPAEMFTPAHPPRWQPLAWGVIPLSTALVCTAPLTELGGNWILMPHRQFGTAAVVLIMLAGVALWIAAADLRGRTGWASAFIWLLLTNLGPVIAELIREGGELDRLPDAAIVLSFSPVAALATLWNRAPRNAWPGIAGQAALLIVPAVFFAVRRLNSRRAVAGPTTLASSERTT